MKLKDFVDENGKRAIEAAVSAAEAGTAGEIVPMVVEASSTYSWVGYRAAMLGWFAASIATFYVHWRYPFALDFWAIYAAQIVGIVLGWGLSRSRIGFHFFVAKVDIEEEVLETARSAFVHHGLANTRDRTGVLVFVSLKERRVQILADKGIHEKVGDGFWRQTTDQIVRSIHEGTPAAGMEKAILGIGEKLAAHFPKGADDMNELPNHVR